MDGFSIEELIASEMPQRQLIQILGMLADGVRAGAPIKRSTGVCYNLGCNNLLQSPFLDVGHTCRGCYDGTTPQAKPSRKAVAEALRLKRQAREEKKAIRERETAEKKAKRAEAAEVPPVDLHAAFLFLSTKTMDSPALHDDDVVTLRNS